MAAFGKSVAKSFAVIGIAAAGAATALGVAVKATIDHADQLSKTAQKIGFSVEALSRLEYAAKLSDVSLEGLSTGLRKFSQAMVEAVGNNNSRPAQIFSALGVAVRDATGNLRASDAVFADVADRLAALKDGSLKTALAVQLFGKSGADLIPLLNGGKQGLKDAADEADRFGVTVSTKTAKASEQFNDTLTRISEILSGVVLKITEAALPAIQDLASTLASPAFAEAAKSLADNVGGAINWIANRVTDLIGLLREAGKQIDYLATHDLFGNKIEFAPGSQGYIRRRFGPGGANEKLKNALTSGNFSTPGDDFFSGIFGGAGGSGGSFSTSTNISSLTTAVAGGATAAKGAVIDLMAGLDDAQPKIKSFAETISDTLTGAFTGFADALLNGVPAGEAFTDMLGNLAKQLANAAIGNLVSSIFGGGGLFGGTTPKLGWTYGMGTYAEGGISARPAIFGERGPEAAVPLPDGRTIPVTLNGGTAGGRVELVLSPDLEARILDAAAAQSVTISKASAPAIENRIKDNMAKGQYRSLGVSPGMNRR